MQLFKRFEKYDFLRILKHSPRLIIRPYKLSTFNFSVSRSDDAPIQKIKRHTIEKTPITAMLWEKRLEMSTQSSSHASSTSQSAAFLKEKTFSESKVTIHYDFSTNDQCMNNISINYVFNFILNLLNVILCNQIFICLYH